MGIFNDAGEAFNQVTDTIGDASEQAVSDAGEAFNQATDIFEDGIPQLVSDGGDAVNYDEGPVDVDTLFPPFDNDSDEGPVDVDTLFPPFDNDSDEGPDNRKEEPPKPSEPDNRKEEPPKPSEPAEAAKDKGIIQLVVVAVVIAGTLGAYLWSRN